MGSEQPGGKIIRISGDKRFTKILDATPEVLRS
jgi:hypothetical protein